MKKTVILIVLILVVATLAVATQKEEKYIAYNKTTRSWMATFSYQQAIDFIRREADDSYKQAGPVYREWEIWRAEKVADIKITFPDDPVLEIKKIPGGKS